MKQSIRLWTFLSSDRQDNINIQAGYLNTNANVIKYPLNYKNAFDNVQYGYLIEVQESNQPTSMTPKLYAIYIAIKRVFNNFHIIKAFRFKFDFNLTLNSILTFPFKSFLILTTLKDQFR